MADRKKKNVKKNDDDTDESNSKLDSSMKNLNFVSKDYSSNSTDDKIRCSEVWVKKNSIFEYFIIISSILGLAMTRKKTNF
jgi:hypothetical protein